MTSSKRLFSIISASSIFGLLSLLPKAMGLIKEAVIAGAFGVSHALDIYLVSFSLICLPVIIFVGSLGVTLVPELSQKMPQESLSLFKSAIIFSLITLIAILPVFLMLLPFFFEIFYSSVNISERNDIFRSIVLLVPHYFLMGINLLFYSFLQSRKRFWQTAVFPVLSSFCICGAVLISDKPSVNSLIVGVSIGTLTETICLLLSTTSFLNILRQKGDKQNFEKVFKLTKPLFIGGVITYLLPTIEQTIALNIGTGTVSVLNYANKIPAALNSLFATAVGVVMLPHFSELLKINDTKAFQDLYLKSIMVAFMFTALVAVGVSIVAEDLLHLFFRRGEFSLSDLEITKKLMHVYLIQLPAQIVAIITVRSLISFEKTYFITGITIFQVALGLIYMLHFSNIYGALGLAIGSVLAIFSGTFILVFYQITCLKKVLNE